MTQESTIEKLKKECYNAKSVGPIKVLYNMLPNNVLVKKAWDAVVSALEAELTKAVEESLDHKLEPLG